MKVDLDSIAIEDVVELALDGHALKNLLIKFDQGDMSHAMFSNAVERLLESVRIRIQDQRESEGPEGYYTESA